MKTLLRKIGTKGFTLIELLTVVAIIAILAGLLFPTFQAARRKAKIAQAQNDVKNIETALKAYYTEYGKWPVGNGSADISYGAFGGAYASAPPTYYPNAGLIATLRSIDDTSAIAYNAFACGNPSFVNNPRKIVFLEVPAASLDSTNNFIDPWKNPYQITLDTSYNNICENLANTAANNQLTPVGQGSTAPGVTNRSAVVWSFGPNGIASSPRDNITSW